MEDCVGPDLTDIRDTVASYYGEKIERHGATPLGVDWSCVPTQEMRFVQLLKIWQPEQTLSINDIGCGYGALFGFLHKRFPRTAIDYLGVDLSAAMIACAKAKRWRLHKPVFLRGHRSPRLADYTVASGIFNVKLQVPPERWEHFIRQTLRDMLDSSRVGFAANFLAPVHPDAQPIAELYRISPEPWLTFCERELGTRVELVQDYGMREFTLLARRKSPV